jgi:hypothetical protein
MTMPTDAEVQAALDALDRTRQQTFEWLEAGRPLDPHTLRYLYEDVRAADRVLCHLPPHSEKEIDLAHLARNMRDFVFDNTDWIAVLNETLSRATFDECVAVGDRLLAICMVAEGMAQWTPEEHEPPEGRKLPGDEDERRDWT